MKNWIMMGISGRVNLINIAYGGFLTSVNTNVNVSFLPGQY